MFSLILAILLTAFPTPERVRTDIARTDSLRAVHYQQLLSGEIEPDFKTKTTLNRIRAEIARDFKISPESYGRIYIPMGNIKGTSESRVKFIKIVLRKELDGSGWRLKEWSCEFEPMKRSKGWIFQWWIVPKVESL